MMIASTSKKRECDGVLVVVALVASVEIAGTLVVVPVTAVRAVAIGLVGTETYTSSLLLIVEIYPESTTNESAKGMYQVMSKVQS